MKELKYVLAGFALISLAYCTSTKKTVGGGTTPPFVPSNRQVEIAQKRWANTNAEELKLGQSIFVVQCTRCHGPYEITGFSEKKWLHEIDDMSPRAGLNETEKLNLTRHILSFRESALAEKNKK